MKIESSERPNNKQSGFALLTVLFGLALVTALLAASLGLTSAHVKITGYEARQQKERALVLGALEVAGALAAAAQTEGAEPLPGVPVPVEIGSRATWVMIQDVGGLVDLNTATQQLMVRMLAGLDAEADLIFDEISIRRMGKNVFRNVEEFVELAAVSPEIMDAARPFLTTYSGRRGINPRAAPMSLLEALAGRRGSRADLVEAVPAALTTPQTGRVFAVSVWIGNLDAQRHRGVIAITLGRRYAMKIIELGR